MGELTRVNNLFEITSYNRKYPEYSRLGLF